jgi:hypothetical protein
MPWCAFEVAVIAPDAIALDAARGVGGMARRRVMAIFSPEASGQPRDSRAHRPWCPHRR